MVISMFKKRVLAAFFIIAVLGTLGHFIYEWTDKNYILGLFFPVSESIWEHLKLLFYPTVIFSSAEFTLRKSKPKNYISAVAKSIFCGMAFIVIIYYLYSGIIGRNIDAINIPLYYISIIFMLYKKEKTLANNEFSFGVFNAVFLFLIIIWGVLFAIFSYNPPSLGIFMQPMLTV